MSRRVDRPKRTRPLVAAPLDVVDLRDTEPSADQPEVIDLRGPEPKAMTWEESASLIEFPQDLEDRIADRRRDSLKPGDLHASLEDMPDEDSSARGS